MHETLPLPKTIGPYRVLGHLGRGGMGEVLRAHDDRLDRPVALKRILPDIREKEKALRRFRREARVAARLSHPSIVQVHDWVESEAEDEGHWLVMELVEGRSLAERIQDGALPWERALDIARDIASGLAAAHDAGLVHRDLKASNVMLDAAGRAKILDFGLAKPLRLDGLEDSAGARPPLASATLTGEGRIVGTVASMSPEQALGKELDHRSDLFSLGVLLYEMLSGSTPFEGSTPVETLTRLCSAREVPLHRLDASIPAELSRLVSRLLEKDPSRRPRDAHELVREIERLRAATRHDGIPRPPEASDGESQEATRFDHPELGHPEIEREEGSPTMVDASAPSRRSTRRLLIALATTMALAGLAFWLAWPTPPADDGQVAGPPTEAVAVESTPYELFQQGMALLELSEREGRITEAIHRFREASAKDQNYAPALAGLALAYRQDHSIGSRDPQRLDQALAAAEEAVRINEHLAFAWISLGLVHLEMGRLDDATRELERAREFEPSSGLAWSGLGRIQEARGEIELAEQLYRRAIELEPKEVEFLGMLLYRSGRYEEAAEAFKAYLELFPDRFRILRNLGVVYYMQGRLSEAATQFQKALLIQPDSTLYANMGTIYFAQGLYARSASAFQQAIENGGSNHSMLWGNLGDAQRWIPGRENEARDAYFRAVQLLREHLADHPTDLTSRTRLALYLAKRGDCDEAFAEIRELAGPPAEDGHAFFRLAVAQEVCGHRADALAALDQALRARFSIEEVRRDPELLNLRRDARYHRMLMRRSVDAE